MNQQKPANKKKYYPGLDNYDKTLPTAMQLALERAFNIGKVKVDENKTLARDERT